MNKIQLTDQTFQELKGESFRMYVYFSSIKNEKSYIWNITREHIEKTLNLGYGTVYKGLNELQKKGYIEYNGYRKEIKLLK